MHTRPVSPHSARFGFLFILAIASGVLSACDDDKPGPSMPAEPGVARLEMPLRTVPPGEALQVRCVADDAQGGPLTYVFDWGNGSDVTRSAEAVPSGTASSHTRVFTEDEEGSFSARCRAVDAEGHEGPWSEAVGYSIRRAPPKEGEADVRIEVVGRGKVLSTPEQIDCPGACRRYFAQGTRITLTPVPEVGWRFVGWAGSFCHGDKREEPVTFTHQWDETCVARFAPVDASAIEWAHTGAFKPDAPAWSPDGRWLAALDNRYSVESRLLIWDAASGRLLKELRGDSVLSSPYSFAWSPSGDRLAVGRKNGVITMLDTATWSTVREWPANMDEVGMLVWSPKGDRLAVMEDDSAVVQLWNVQTNAWVPGPILAKSPVRCMKWSPDGTRLALEAGPATLEGRYQAWVEIHASSSGSLETLQQGAESIAWSPDGTRYALGGLREVRVHETATHQLKATWSATPYSVASLDWSGSSRWLVAADMFGALLVLDANTGAQVADASRPGDEGGRYDGLALHPFQPSLAVVDRDPAVVRILTFDEAAHTMHARELLPHVDTVRAVAWSPAGDRVASGGEEGLVQVWDKQGTQLRTLSGHGGKPIWAVAWDGSGDRLATGGADGQACVWNVDEGTLVRAPFQHAEGNPEPPYIPEVRVVALSPDGHFLASVSEVWVEGGGRVSTVRVWDVSSGAELYRLPRRDEGLVKAVAWTPEGRYLLAANSDMTWELWDRETGALRRVDSGLKAYTGAFSLSPDGTRLVVGNVDRVRILDVGTGALLQESPGSQLARESFTVNVLAWSADGRRVAGGGVRGMVFVWDTADTRFKPTVIGFHRGDVSAVSWRPDGTAVTTGSTDVARLSTWRFAP
ncbi:WD40 repeat domain-containing protein [Pyxidicoccus parkwayensis]|uniref:WD40 repeat domain-containing protein n=1 Tax=Pyxidicoccus parkwayensis TaxID=2813578 RepID=A0ABX7P6R4_9BACT|nr:WD40 repeat domain-containing protein [Pyxidicoccus parkwaysis]QSQ26167.1 WD40 repeat domain-containing protein [Pyxidicoccus parkwaysis]